MLVFVVVLQLLAHYIVNRDARRLASVLLLFSFELPTLLFVLSRLFRWTRRRGISGVWFVVMGIFLAAAVGSSWGALFHAVSQAFPGLGLRAFTTPPFPLSRDVLYGLT